MRLVVDIAMIVPKLMFMSAKIRNVFVIAEHLFVDLARRNQRPHQALNIAKIQIEVIVRIVLMIIISFAKAHNASVDM